jgi:hypothetical protein
MKKGRNLFETSLFLQAVLPLVKTILFNYNIA